MSAEVPGTLVEKAARAAYAANPLYRTIGWKITDEVLPWDELPLETILGYRKDAHAALAAVLPEIQAQTLQPFFDLRLRTANTSFEALTRDSVVRCLDAALHTARMTTTTEEPTT